MHQGIPAVHQNRISKSVLTRLPEGKELIHLLKRILPGIRFSEYCDLRNKPVEQVARELLNAPFHFTAPVKDYTLHNGVTDANVAVGETWVHDNNYDFQVNVKRKESLKKWLTGLLYTQQRSVRPKMILFWHNYFPLQLQRITLATKAFDYFSTIIGYSLESFRELLLYQETSFALLEYHKKIKPSGISLAKFHADRILNHYLFGEDYARIISRDRIKKLTRLIGEWSAINDNLALSASRYHGSQPTNFDEKPVIREFLRELDSFNQKLLEYGEVAYNLSAKIFRWFAHYEFDKTTENEIFNRMVVAALENNYEIKSILSSLLLNDRFYSSKYCGGLIKSPVEYLFGICKELDCISIENAESVQHYPVWEWMLQQLSKLGQSPGDLPDERGWPAYYDLPQKTWITPEMVIERKRLTGEIIIPRALSEGRISHNFVRQLLDRVENASSMDAFIEFLVNFYSSTNYFHKKVMTVREYFLANYPVTERTWKSMVEALQLQPDNKQVYEKLTPLVTDMIMYFQDSPEYNFC